MCCVELLGHGGRVRVGSIVTKTRHAPMRRTATPWQPTDKFTIDTAWRRSSRAPTKTRDPTTTGAENAFAPRSHSATGAPSVAETTKTRPSVDTATSLSDTSTGALKNFAPGTDRRCFKAPLVASRKTRPPRSSATQTFAPTTATGA